MKKTALVILILSILVSSVVYGGGTKDSAADKVYTIVIGESGSELTSNYQGYLAFKPYVENASKGRIKVEIHANAILGNDRELLESVQIGQVTMMATGLTQHTNFVPELNTMDAPFLYETTEQVYRLFEDKEFYDMFSKLYANQGYYFVGMTFQGFRTLTSNKPVRTVADCNRMSIRVIQSPTPIAIWQALGSNPTPLAFPEVYTALQQGVVDAQENPMELIYSQKFYEQQKYVIDTNHQIQPTLVVFNLDFYNSLPADLRAIVDEGFKVCLKAIREYTDSNLDMYEKTMRDYGCTFIELTPQARAEFKDRTAGVRADLAAQYPAFYRDLEAALARVK